MVVARTAVCCSVELRDFLLAGSDAQFREVHAVRTHIGDASVFIQALGNHHRLTHGEAQTACRLLLQRRRSEGRRRRTLQRFLRHGSHAELCILACFEESHGLVVLLEAVRQLGFHLRLRSVVVGNGKDGIHAVVGFTLESLDFALAFYDQAHRNALHTTCRQRWLDLAPQHRRELEAHQTVQHAACLLCVYEVHVQPSGVLDRLQDGRLGDFVEHDTVCIGLVQTQHLAQVP